MSETNDSHIEQDVQSFDIISDNPKKFILNIKTATEVLESSVPKPVLKIITSDIKPSNNDGICQESRKKGGKCTFKATHGNICTYHFNKKLKERGEKLPLIAHDGKTKECNCKSHNYFGSIYLKEKVPVENFYKPSNKDNNLYSQCIDCRNYDKKVHQKIKDKKLEMVSQQTDDTKKVCMSESHDIPGVSSYPRNAVPKEMFQYKAQMEKKKAKIVQIAENIEKILKTLENREELKR